MAVERFSKRKWSATLRWILVMVGTALIFITAMPFAISSYGILQQRTIDRITIWWGCALCLWMRCAGGIRLQLSGHISDYPVILAANHQSSWETFFLPAYVPQGISIVMKRNLLKLPIFRTICKRLGAIAIDREQSIQAISIIETSVKKVLSLKRYVCIFPQGKRVALTETPPLRAGGIGILYRKLAMDIQPVIHNSGHVWLGKGKFQIIPGTISCVFLPPITQGQKAKDAVVELERTMYQTLAILEAPGSHKPVEINVESSPQNSSQ